MDLWFVHPDGIEPHDESELVALLERTDGFVWIDLLAEDEHAGPVLTEVLRAHPLVVADVPQTQPRADRARLRRPRLRRRALTVRGRTPGTCTCSSSTSLVGRRYLVHGARADQPGRGPRRGAARDDRRCAARIERGTFRPASPAELSHGIGSAIVRSAAQQ